MVKAKHVKKARRDFPEFGIKKGDSYWWWQFAYHEITRSKEKPRRSDLTQSWFEKQVFDLEEDLLNTTSKSEMISIRKEILSLKEEVLKRRSSMPGSLKDVKAGKLLKERAHFLEEWVGRMVESNYTNLESNYDKIK